ncbi:MAG: sulfurtransferase [Flavobacteriales bacterium]|nr:sulfurtransferase [Flavobacteriales bacterium]
MNTPLVSTEWLNEHLNDDDLVILDVSQKIAVDNIAIAGARYFDVKNVFSDATSEFPNTFPSAAQFEAGCQQLGIDSDSKIVVYDNKGVFLSPRVWWMFTTFGHQNVAVLDGGLPEWLANSYETETGFDSEFDQGDFKAQLQPKQVIAYDFVKANLSTKKALLIDARSAGRFNGTESEPRKDLRGGNIPGSINLPYTEVLAKGKFKSIPELKEVFRNLETENRPFVFTCGSGVTACIILLASELVMQHENAMYDGSWTEWAQLEDE